MMDFPGIERPKLSELARKTRAAIFDRAVPDAEVHRLYAQLRATGNQDEISIVGQEMEWRSPSHMQGGGE